MTVTIPFALIGLDHVVLRVSNLTAVKTFYESVLGCTVEREQHEIGLYQLRAGRSLIDIVTIAGKLGTAGGGAPGYGGGNMDHIAIAIDPFDDDAIRRHLASFAIPVDESGIRYGAEGEGPSIYIRDPEGNRVELKGPPTP